jgi:hypothetical protein
MTLRGIYEIIIIIIIIITIIIKITEVHSYNCFVSFRSPSLFYLLTIGVQVVYFHLITDTHHSR